MGLKCQKGSIKTASVYFKRYPSQTKMTAIILNCIYCLQGSISVPCLMSLLTPSEVWRTCIITPTWQVSQRSGPTGVINIRVRTQTHVCNLSFKALSALSHTLLTRACVCAHTHTRQMHRGAHTSPCTQVSGPEDWVCNTFFIVDLPINPCL